MSWQCVRCETVNPETVEECEVCETRRTRTLVYTPVKMMVEADSEPLSTVTRVTESTSELPSSSLNWGWHLLTIFFILGSLFGGYSWGRSNPVIVVQEVESQNQRATLETQRELIDDTSSTFYDLSLLLSGTKLGEMQGDLIHDANENSVVKHDFVTGELVNFIAEVRFYNPFSSSTKIWDYGMAFRSTGGGEQYRLQIRSNQTWELGYWGDDNGGILVNRGELKSLDISENGSNCIRLIVVNQKGWFFLNGKYITQLDLSKKIVSGFIWVGTGFFSGDKITGKVTKYNEFTVWSLPDMPLPSPTPTSTPRTPTPNY